MSDVLIGNKYGRLTVVSEADFKVQPSGQKKRMWLCECECKKGNLVVVADYSLKKGLTRSCGCLNKELASKRAKRFNEYEVQEDYVVMYTRKQEMFLIDLEDFWKVKDKCWFINKEGYVCHNDGQGTVYLHRMIMSNPEGLRVDHIKGENSRYDNRKCNLRVVTTSQNASNSKQRKDNNSGCRGVTWLKDYKKWRARITKDNHCHIIGYYDTKEEAIAARKEAERYYFGEYSYDFSQRMMLD